MKTRLRYIYSSPRGFANETAVYSYDPHNAAEAAAVADMLDAGTGWARRITRREAYHITAANRREGGTLQNPVGAKHVQRLADAMREWPQD